jgi:transcription antitermination factor NusG
MLIAIDTRTGVSHPATTERASCVVSETRRFAIASAVNLMTTDKGEAPTFNDATDQAESKRSWYAVWTRRQCEERVTDELTSRGFEIFLPKAQAWVQQRGRRRRLWAPLFPGYLFLRHGLDAHSHADVLRARGVVRLLGDGGEPIPIQDVEIDAVRRLAGSGLPLSRRGPIDRGDSVRIVAGPLAGLEGRFVRSRPHRGLFVIAVTLLRRSVAVEVEAAFVEAT